MLVTMIVSSTGGPCRSTNPKSIDVGARPMPGPIPTTSTSAVNRPVPPGMSVSKVITASNAESIAGCALTRTVAASPGSSGPGPPPRISSEKLTVSSMVTASSTNSASPVFSKTKSWNSGVAASTRTSPKS